MTAAHDWQPAGTMDDGTRRYRCATCGVGKTWPEAHAKCGAITAEEAPRTSKKHQRPIASVIAGRVPNRVCRVCETHYFSQRGNSRYCSRPCAKSAWDVQHAASQAKSALRHPETPKQRLLRTERQRARRADERAAS